jgi:phage tail sheath protein FI
MATYTYPGVYIQELQSGVHPISGVPTSIAAFIGYTATGIDNRAQQIFSFSDFERLYGGVASNSELSYAVQQFFLNGGAQAWVVRTPGTSSGAAPATVAFGPFTFSALSSGKAANCRLLIDIDYIGLNPSTDPTTFNLTVTNLADGTTEPFPSVTYNLNKSNFVKAVVNDPDNGSQLVNITSVNSAALTALSATTPASMLPVTGIVGTTITAPLGIGGTATVDYGLALSTVLPQSPPGGLPLSIKVLAKNSVIPQTLSGIAAQLQQAINAALAVQMPKASVTVTLEPLSGGTAALRVNALLPNCPDAVLSFAAPLAGSNLTDVSAILGLSGPGVVNVAHYTLGTTHVWESQSASAAGVDGNLPATQDLIGDPAAFTGVYALQKVDLFNLLSIPDATRALPSDPSSLDSTVDPNSIYSAAIALCDQRRAFLLIDPPPNVTTVSGAVDWKSTNLTVVDPNGAAFFPRLRLPDPKNGYQLRTFAPSGVVAGVYATTDSSRGVWKAPAGISAVLNGVQSMVYKLSDPENGVLNPLGLNCFRTFPVYGSVLWGARTLVGADAAANQWKYVPVRRTALFIEESLYRGTKWVVFEPNDELLWASIRLNVGAFMQSLFLKGAFQGTTPDEAYLVKCDSETTTQADIDLGIVNILVGFAPLKPAEFVVIQIEQLAGQGQS